MTDEIRIPRPEIHTGPKHQTVNEATIAYLTEAAERVRTKQIWGSGVSALVATILEDVATALLATPAPEAARDAHRDRLGRRVREVWVMWAQQQRDPKPTWLVGWDDLPEPDREVDRRIGSALWADGFADGLNAAPAPDLPTTVQADRDAEYQPCSHECNGCPTCDPGLRPEDRDAGQVTDAMVEAALAEYRISDHDGKALVRAMLRAALAARQSADTEARGVERVEWGVQKRCYPLGTGYRIYGGDEEDARAAAPKVIGSGAYVIRRVIRTIVGEWAPIEPEVQP